MSENNDIKSNLEIISNIKAGYIDNAPILSLTSWFNNLSTMWYKQNRVNNILFIEDVIDKAIEILPLEIDLIILLKRAKQGIVNLKDNYRNNTDILQRINTIIDKTDKEINKFDKWLTLTIDQLPYILKNDLKISTYKLDSFDIMQTPISLTPHISPDLTPPLTPNKVKSMSPTPTPPSSPSRKRKILYYNNLYMFNLNKRKNEISQIDID